MNRPAVLTILMLSFVCIADISAQPAAGVPQFAGTWNGCYTSTVFHISIPVVQVFQQLGKTVTGSYLSKTGAQGVTYGLATSQNQMNGTSLQFSNICPGSFGMKASITNDVLTWSFDGADCKGIEIGTGTATRAPAAPPACPPTPIK